jgi:predicted nuclease of predicted toxin-antitoxin system
MSLAFLADQCVPASISQTLRLHGHSVTLLRDVLPIRTPDVIVIAKAKELDMILVSLNGDFMDIVVYPPADYRGIAAIQLHNHPEVIPQVMRRFRTYTEAHPDQGEYVGKLLIVEPHRIRIRH